MEKLKWTTKKLKLKDLIPLEYNPRKISEDKKAKLIRSLEKFNLAEIPCVNADNKIIGGNQRVMALMMMGRGEEEIDVRFPNRQLSELEVKEYAIISNAHAGEFDWDLVDLHFDVLDFDEIGFDLPDFSWNQVNDKAQVADDDFEVKDDVETDIVEGDIFDIGQHRLLCGSSTQTDTWKRLMGQELADLVITDPPYNVDYKGGNGKKIMNDKQTDENFYQFLYDFYTALGSYTKAGGAWYVWYVDHESMNFHGAFRDAGLKLQTVLIWNKNSLVLGRLDYHKKHEPCIYGWKEGAAHGWYSDRKQTTVLNFDRPTRNAEHPTMKPVSLIAYQMNNSSKEGDIVADGFGGSGTTMVAAEQLKRRCRMMELDPKYCQVIIDRMINLNPSIVIKKNGKEWNTQTKY